MFLQSLAHMLPQDKMRSYTTAQSAITIDYKAGLAPSSPQATFQQRSMLLYTSILMLTYMLDDSI